MKSEKKILQVGDEWSYDLTVRNDSSFTVHNVFLAPSMPILDHGLILYVPGRTVAERAGSGFKPIADARINDGLNFGTIRPGEQATLRFSMKLAKTGGPQVAQFVGQLKADEMPQWRQCASLVVAVPEGFDSASLSQFLVSANITP